MIIWLAKLDGARVIISKKAIENFLEEREDYLLALAVLERNEPTKTLEEVRKSLGLER